MIGSYGRPIFNISMLIPQKLDKLIALSSLYKVVFLCNLNSPDCFLKDCLQE